ncbi:LysR substrate-binding domain-containing protein [Holophaga foetida]|uniref:LysR substrate-binding domain-containing protein n=1 Tax=Holophaga foetida TaxID=35839 RepID=UPI0002474CC5|nr:LysR family transcriptional regulator [Holophaga foetida]
MNVDRLRCFTAVAEQQSFTKASIRLNLSQSAVSYQIAALEDSLGFQLFTRDSRKVLLTRTGKYFLECIRKIINEYNTAIHLSQQLELGQVGEIKLGYLSFTRKPFLPLFLKRFKNENPSITMQHASNSIPGLINALNNGDIDIAFTLNIGFRHSEKLSYVSLSKEEHYVLLPSDHPLASRTSVRLCDLKGYPFVSMDPEVCVVDIDWLETLCERHGFRPEVVRTSKDPESLFMLVQAGIGINLHTRYAAEHFNTFDLPSIPLIDEDAAVDFLVVWRKDSDNPCIPTFLNKLGVSLSV